MVSELLIKGLLQIVKGLLSLIPAFSWDISNSAFGTFLELFCSICYLLPVNTIVIILGLSASLTIARAVISLIKTIWAMLPLV